MPENNCNDVSDKTPCFLMAKDIYSIQIYHLDILLKYYFPHPSFMSLLLYHIQLCYLRLWAGFHPSQLIMHVSSSKTKGPTTTVLQVMMGKFSHAMLIKQFGPWKCCNWHSCSTTNWNNHTKIQRFFKHLYFPSIVIIVTTFIHLLFFFTLQWVMSNQG